MNNKLIDLMRKGNLLKDEKPKQNKEDVSYKELKSMKKEKYEEKKENMDTSYVIQNKRTNQIVEVKAISPILAAKTVGWRPRHTRILQVNSGKNE